MIVKLNDNTELTALTVIGQSRYFQGANRDSLEIVFAKGAHPFDTLDVLFADPSKTGHITLIDDTDPNNPALFVHDGYMLRMSMSLAPVIVTPATPTAPAVTQERISVIMAQETYIEHQLRALGVI